MSRTSKRRTHVAFQTTPKTPPDFNQELLDPRWLAFCAKIKLRDGMVCRDCGSDKLAVNVHIVCYMSEVPLWEFPEDLFLTLCDKCSVERKKNERAAFMTLGRLISSWPIERLNDAVWFWIDQTIKETQASGSAPK